MTPLGNSVDCSRSQINGFVGSLAYTEKGGGVSVAEFFFRASPAQTRNSSAWNFIFLYYFPHIQLCNELFTSKFGTYLSLAYFTQDLIIRMEEVNYSLALHRFFNVYYF